MKFDESKAREWGRRFSEYGRNPKSLRFPERITIEPTNLCNLNCRMCPRRKMSSKQGLMEMGLFRRIVDEIASSEKETKVVLFFRGESLIHPQFKEMLSYLNGAGVRDISLATNAVLLTKDVSEHILKAGLRFVSFSIDASSEENYKKQRIGADWNTVLANVGYFLSRKEELGLNSPQTQVSLVETESSKGEVEGFVKYWQQLVDRVRIYEEHSTGDGFGGGGIVASSLGFERRLPCPKVLTDMVVYWNGDVAICNHDWDRKDSLGNLREMTISSVWSNGKYHAIREKHILGELASEKPCDLCDYWKPFYTGKGMFGKLFVGASGKASQE